MSNAHLALLALGLGMVIYWIVVLRREVRKEYAVGREQGQRARNLVLMGASATFWAFLTLIYAGVDLSVWGMK